MKSLLALVAALMLVSASAHGQANLTFSGGNGSPFSLTIAQPIVFTITSAFSSSNGPQFVFQNLGNILGSSSQSVTASITYSINGGANFTIDFIRSGLSLGMLGPNDVFIAVTSALPGANIGDVIRLSSGTLTTTGNVAAAPPANGSYNTVIIDSNGTISSTNGLAIPEPRSAALFAAGGLGVLYLARRRRVPARG